MKKQKPLLLIYPPYEGKFMLESRPPFPIGLLYLAAFLSEKGIEARIMDFSYPHTRSMENNIEGRVRLCGWPFDKIRRWLSDHLQEFDNTLVGISSLMTTNHAAAYKLVALVKEIDPSLKTILGGPHAIIFPNHVRQESMVDYICIGEGELSLYQFLSTGKTGNGIYKLKDGLPVAAGPVLVDDLNILPFPERSLLLESKTRDLSETTVTFSRGCPNRCSFCASHLVQGRKWRHKSVERVLEEITWYVKKWGASSFLVEDDNICPHKEGIEWLKEICRRVVKAKGELGKLSFHIPHGMPVYAIADKELCVLIWEAGFRHMVLPLESTDQGVLEDMNKTFTAKFFNQAAENWEEYEKHSPVEIILGYPFVETIGSMLKTMKEVATRRLILWPSYFKPNRGLRLFDRCVEAGYIDQEKFDPMALTDFSVETERFTLPDLKELRQICRGVNYGTELGVNVFEDDPQKIKRTVFEFCYTGRTRLAAKGNFSYRKGQENFTALLVAKIRRDGQRPIMRISGNTVLIHGFTPSKVYIELNKLWDRKAEIKH